MLIRVFKHQNIYAQNNTHTKVLNGQSYQWVCRKRQKKTVFLIDVHMDCNNDFEKPSKIEKKFMCMYGHTIYICISRDFSFFTDGLWRKKIQKKNSNRKSFQPKWITGNYGNMLCQHTDQWISEKFQ